MKTPADVTQFKAYLNDLWINVAMMDYPYPTDFLMPLPGDPVNAICGEIEPFTPIKTNQTVLKAISAAVNLYNNYTGTAKCLSYTSGPDQIGADMWDYQACSEMVMPMCFDGKNDMFEKAAWNETAFVLDCQTRWKVTPRPQMADIMYGSKSLFGASNIVFR
jgi:lysosomal Pro-X carboxypeptidase